MECASCWLKLIQITQVTFELLQRARHCAECIPVHWHSHVSSRVTNSTQMGCLARTFSILKLKVLGPRRLLSPGQTGIVDHPRLLGEFCLVVTSRIRAESSC